MAKKKHLKKQLKRSQEEINRLRMIIENYSLGSFGSLGKKPIIKKHKNA